MIQERNHFSDEVCVCVVLNEFCTALCTLSSSYFFSVLLSVIFTVPRLSVGSAKGIVLKVKGQV